MSYTTPNKKCIPILYADETIYNSFCDYQDSLPSSRVEAAKQIQQDLWDSLKYPKGADTLRNALISGADVNEDRNGTIPLHLILASKNEIGLTILLKYSQSLKTDDKKTSELAHNWGPEMIRTIQNGSNFSESSAALSSTFTILEQLPLRTPFNQQHHCRNS